MKLKYLGTAAAEAVPALFCECEVCQKARKYGGRRVRSRSQALVDNALLIDFPCDTCWHMVQNGLSLLDYRYCLITHVHEDHFSPTEIAYIRKGYATVLPEDYGGFHVYGSPDITGPLAPIREKAPDRLFAHAVEPFTPFTVGEYRVTALPAHHGTDHPYNYIVERDGKALLYLHDTGRPLPETWDYLRAHPVRFSLVSLDCCSCNAEPILTGGHMGLADNIDVRDGLVAAGLADGGTVFVLNHFSHNGADADYEAFCAIAQKRGFLVSFDGMEIPF